MADDLVFHFGFPPGEVERMSVSTVALWQRRGVEFLKRRNAR